MIKLFMFLFQKMKYRQEILLCKVFLLHIAQYYNEENPEKRICFYFLKPDGNIQTPYLMFNYRIMATLGVEFLKFKRGITTNNNSIWFC